VFFSRKQLCIKINNDKNGGDKVIENEETLQLGKTSFSKCRGIYQVREIEWQKRMGNEK